MSARFAMRLCETCDRQVLVKADGRCPRCNAQLVESDAQQVVSMKLSRAVRQPHLCVQCGGPTHRLVRVRAFGAMPPASAKPNVPLLLKLVLPPFLPSMVRAVRDGITRHQPTVCLRIRQCLECAKQEGRPVGFAPNFDTRTMSFEVHPRYAAALERESADVRRQDRLKSKPPRGDDSARPVSPS